MGLREAIEKKKPLAVTVASLVLVGAVVAIIVQARSFGPGGAVGKVYFTVDDGQTYFEEDDTNMPPFDYKGKQAVRAHLFRCGGNLVVGYMSRWSAESLGVIREAKEAKAAGKPVPNPQKLAKAATTGMEFKRPGAGGWINQATPEGVKIRTFRCPDGSSPSEAFPE